MMKKIIAYKSFFSDFILTLSQEERGKIKRALDLFKEFRIFFIYDGEVIVVLFNAFRKKTQKTPDSEIRKAIRLKEGYYGTKGNQ